MSQHRIDAVINCCNIDGRCETKGFELVRVPAFGEAERVNNDGGTFGEETTDLITKCRAGDLYMFRRITFQCPGDLAYRHGYDLSVEIE